jgi:ankyrin repeat protein
VKFDDKIKVETFVKKEKRYLFAIDYFSQTAYHWAAKRGYIDILKILVKYGNNINQTDCNLRTPLWHAAKNNHYAVCQVLLEESANPFLEASNGKKPMEVSSDASIRKLINEYMEVRK